MKFLCDVHISFKISKRIERLGFQTEHVNNVLNRWKTKDDDIAKYVDQNDLILITKDQDFRNSFLLQRKPKKLILATFLILNLLQYSKIILTVLTP